ncbi:MAG: glycosyltransferase family 4 protein, partial [Armatimonadetes bacterium]|nr:glycosyltransferase family 4 protein [Armatimonadota bacterium]
LAARRRFRSSRREALQAGPQEFIILFAGGLWFDKGLPLVIDALALMEHPARLVIVGRGDEEFFARLAQERGVADRVLFAGVTDSIVEYYAAADCLVMPARGEAFGLVVAEAAGCGLPLVTTDIGAADELVENGVSGFRVGQDPAQIADRLDRLAADPVLSQRMGTAAHHKAQLLSWDRQADQIEEFFLTHLPDPDTEQLAPAKPARPGRFVLSEAPDPLRVAVISHSCVIDLNQRPYAELLDYADIDLRLFSPQRWWAPVGGEVQFSALPEIADCSEALPVWLPGQIHLHWHTSQLAQKLDEFRPDVLFVDEEPYSLAAAQAARLASGLGYKLVIFTKENIQRRLPLPFEWIYKRVLAGSDHVFVV